MSALPPLADIARCREDVHFSNRPVGVKRFQTIHGCSVDVARGLALLYGIGTSALVWGFLSQGGWRIFSGVASVPWLDLA